MTRLLKDPLLHFLLLGGAIFGVHSWRSEGEQGDRRVVVPEAEVAALWEAMAMLSGATPTEADIRALVEPRIREEILYREALRLGLDRDDSQIRQRLVEKMSFLSEDLNVAEPLNEEEIVAFFEANRDAFVEPARLTLEQIYFSPSEDGDEIADAASAALLRLQTSRSEPQTALERDVSVRRHENVVVDDLSGELGQDFAEAVMSLPADGTWHGPVRSVFGMHLVRVMARSEAYYPPLAEIRERVVVALETERRQRANDTAYRELRSSYDVVIEIPDDARREWMSEASSE